MEAFKPFFAAGLKNIEEYQVWYFRFCFIDAIFVKCYYFYCYTSDRNVWLWLVQIASRGVS